MRNTPYQHRPVSDPQNADSFYMPEQMMSGSLMRERMHRRVITITRIVRMRIEEFLPASVYDGEHEDLLPETAVYRPQPAPEQKAFAR